MGWSAPMPLYIAAPRGRGYDELAHQALSRTTLADEPAANSSRKRGSHLNNVERTARRKRLLTWMGETVKSTQEVATFLGLSRDAANKLLGSMCRDDEVIMTNRPSGTTLATWQRR